MTHSGDKEIEKNVRGLKIVGVIALALFLFHLWLTSEFGLSFWQANGITIVAFVGGMLLFVWISSETKR